VSGEDEAALDTGTALALVDAVYEEAGQQYITQPEMRRLSSVRVILDAAPSVQLSCFKLVAEEWLRSDPHRSDPRSYIGGSLRSLIGRRRLPIDAAFVDELLAAYERIPDDAPWEDLNRRWWAVMVLIELVPSLDAFLTAAPELVAEPIKRRLHAIEPDANRWHQAGLNRLRALGAPGSGLDLTPLSAEYDVGARLRAVFESLPAGAPAEGLARVAIGGFAGPRPSGKWQLAARRAGEEMPGLDGVIASLLAAIAEAGDRIERVGTPGQESDWVTFTDSPTEDAMRGAAWLAAMFPDASRLPVLASVAGKCSVIIGGQFGQPRSVAVANAAVLAIAHHEPAAAMSVLLRLERTLRHGAVLNTVRKGVAELAERSGVTPSELLELAVDRHGLDDDASKTVPIGDHAATIRVVPPGVVEVTYADSSGVTVRRLPASVRSGYAEAYAQLRAEQKAIAATAANERVRVERLLAERRSWPLSLWRERYLTHPITRAVASRVIWRSGSAVGIADADGQLIDAAAEVRELSADASIEIWHPLTATEDDIRGWRARLVADGIRQPFKQAFRELYVLTPAELETGQYSNRFAAHVIGQVQVRALIKARGWTTQPIGWWDDGVEEARARRVFAAYDLAAEWRYDAIYDFEPTETSLYPYCSTDQVRFVATDRGEVVDLVNVPPIVFSEAMRDVDLFVGVSSIGADPNWLDTGQHAFDDYWHTWGFGEIGERGTIRHDLLAEIIPSLAIADRLTLEDRYLRVRGDLRTYKVHLGSSNILMEPDDRYLCIVPGGRSGPASRVFLPFDDDQVLSTILSKAFLLAADKKITDPSITMQITPAAG
jgi:hypothetical protein